MSMCMPVAQAHTKCAPQGSQALRLRYFHFKSCISGLLWRFCKIPLYRGPCMMLYRSLTEGLVEILVRSSSGGFCMKILQMTFPRGACMKAIVGGSWEVPVSRSCKTRSSSSMSFLTILWRSYRAWHRFLQVLVKGSCGDPCEILSDLCMILRRPCEKLLKRPGWNPVGVLTSSRTGPWEDLVGILLKIFEMSLH